MEKMLMGHLGVGDGLELGFKRKNVNLSHVSTHTHAHTGKRR